MATVHRAATVAIADAIVAAAAKRNLSSNYTQKPGRQGRAFFLPTLEV